jgi:predicted secreted protein
MCMNPKMIIFSLAIGLSFTAPVAAGDHARVAPEYFSPRPSTFNAYTYSASVQLTPSGPQRLLRGEFKFPLFSATPNVSAQIISSNAAAPMQVDAITVDERADASGSMATVVVVEAKPIFDGASGGLYYVNVTVTGVPAAGSKTSAM